MFDPQSDPLGLGLKARARERRQSLQTLNPQNPAFMSGPLPDENWDAFFQAVGESNPGKAVKFGGGSDASSPVGTGIDADTPGTRFAASSKQFRGEPHGGNSLIGSGTHGQNLLYGGAPQRKKNSLQSLLDLVNQGKI
jgi:hypothetical protein